jgi:hypothetical protein
MATDKIQIILSEKEIGYLYKGIEREIDGINDLIHHFYDDPVEMAFLEDEKITLIRLHGRLCAAHAKLLVPVKSAEKESESLDPDCLEIV